LRWLRPARFCYGSPRKIFNYYDRDAPFEFGKGQIFYRPDGLAQVALVTHSQTLVANAIRAAKDLEKKRLRQLLQIFIRSNRLIPRLICGLLADKSICHHRKNTRLPADLAGGAVAELLRLRANADQFIGVHDEYGQSGTRRTDRTLWNGPRRDYRCRTQSD